MASAQAATPKVVSMTGERLKRDQNKEWFFGRTDDYLEQMEMPPPHPMMVGDIKPRGGVAGMNNAQGGGGKSTADAMLAVGLAYWRPGQTWMGHQIHEDAQGKVAIFSGDEPYSRMQHMLLKAGGKQAKLDFLEKHRSRQTRIKLFGVSDVMPMFIGKGEDAEPTDYWKQVCDALIEWNRMDETPLAMVKFDTIASLNRIGLDNGGGQIAAMLQHSVRLAEELGCPVEWNIHNNKQTVIRNTRTALAAMNGSAQFGNAVRYVQSMWEAHTELAQAVVEAGLGGATKFADVRCMGNSKGNIDELETEVARCYVRQPKDGPYFRDLVDVTAQVRKLEGGMDLLAGVQTKARDATARSQYARMTADERKELERLGREEERQQSLIFDEQVRVTMERENCDAVRAVEILDAAKPAQDAPKQRREDKWAAERIKAETRALTDTRVQEAMSNHGLDAFGACRFVDDGKLSPAARRRVQ